MYPIKLSGLSVEETNKIIPSNTILLGYMGSHSHGTHIPNTDINSVDDTDIMGVCIAPINVYCGVKEFKQNKFEQLEVKDDKWDSTVYEVRKFVGLLLKQNPNVLGLLWLPQGLYIHISEFGQRLIDNRKIFVSRQAYHSFVNYARSQMHKMTCGVFKGYMGQKRKALVEKYGYDCKNAAHLIRLLRMGMEFLVDGELQVHRGDAKQLKEIKTGLWKLEDVKKEAERLFILAQEAFIRSSLPIHPDYKEAEKILISILHDHFKMET